MWKSMRQDPEETTIIVLWGKNKNKTKKKPKTCSLSISLWKGKILLPLLKERKLQALHDAVWHPHVSLERNVREEKKQKTARGRVQRGNSRVSRLQVHSLSQALLVSSKLGMDVFSTLCSPSRCFLLSDLSEGREAGIAQHTQSLSSLLFLPFYTQSPEDGPGIPLLIPICARCSVMRSLCHSDSIKPGNGLGFYICTHAHTHTTCHCR